MRSARLALLVNVATAAIFGIMRVAGHKSVIFQALAHVYVGALFGAYIGGKITWCKVIAVVLSLLELFCFLKDHGFI